MEVNLKKNLHEIYPPEVKLKKENVNNNEATFLDLHVCLNERQIITCLYDKRDSFPFAIVRFPYKCSTLLSKMYDSTISAELLRIARATSSFSSSLKTGDTFISRMKRQGATSIGVKNILRKMLNRYNHKFSRVC